jgi:hypothetical protein
LQENRRVFHEEFGPGSVVYYKPGEIYPLQVEFDKPDLDGHNVYRFAADELTAIEKEKPMRHIARVSMRRLGYNIGDEYIIGPTNEHGYYSVYLMNGSIIGSYITNFFEMIRPYIEPETDQVEIEPELPEIEPIEEPAAITPIEVKTAEIEPKRAKKQVKKKKVSEQLSIFDFLEE